MIGSVEHIESDGKHVNHIRIKAEILSTFHSRTGESEPREGREKTKKTENLSSTAPIPSFRILDIYTQECIGQGSFGTVYRAVAEGYSSIGLKITTGKPSRLQEELNVLRRVCTKGHLSLPRFEFGAFNDKMDLLVIGMELCIPSTLHDLLLSTRLTNEADMLFLGYAVVVALSCLHSEGCIHRDVKLQNFIFDVEGNIKLIDYGLAATTTHPPAGDIVAGTVSFMSPEMAYNVLHRERRVSVGIEADMWSLGIVLFSIFTQRNPYSVAPDSAMEEKKVKGNERSGSRTTERDGGDSGSSSKGGGEETDCLEEESTHVPNETSGTEEKRPVELLHRVEVADWGWPEGSHISPAMKSLIESLLVKNPSHRPTIDQVLNHKIWSLRRRCPPAAVTAFLGVEDEFLMSTEETCLLKAVSTMVTEKCDAANTRRPASCPLVSSAQLASPLTRSFSASSHRRDAPSCERKVRSEDGAFTKLSCVSPSIPLLPHHEYAIEDVPVDTLPPLLQGRTSLKVVTKDKVELGGGHHLTTIYDIRGGEAETKGGRKASRCRAAIGEGMDSTHATSTKKGVRKGVGSGSAAVALRWAWHHSPRTTERQKSAPLKEIDEVIRDASTSIARHRERSTTPGLPLASACASLGPSTLLPRSGVMGTAEEKKRREGGSKVRYRGTSTDVLRLREAEEEEGGTRNLVTSPSFSSTAVPDGKGGRRALSTASEMERSGEEEEPLSYAAFLRHANTAVPTPTDEEEVGQAREYRNEREGDVCATTSTSRRQDRGDTSAGDTVAMPSPNDLCCRPAGEDSGREDEDRPSSASDAAPPPPPPPLRSAVCLDPHRESSGGDPLASCHHVTPTAETGEGEKGERWKRKDASIVHPSPPLTATPALSPPESEALLVEESRSNAWKSTVFSTSVMNRLVPPTPLAKELHSEVIQEEQRERKWLSSLLVLQLTHCIKYFQSMMEEDQNRAHFLWLEEAQRGSADHPHVYHPCTRAATGTYRFGYVCDSCDYDYLPAAKRARMFYYHCACGRDMCEGCFHAYERKYTCPRCWTAFPNGAAFRAHIAIPCTLSHRKTHPNARPSRGKERKSTAGTPNAASLQGKAHRTSTARAPPPPPRAPSGPPATSSSTGLCTATAVEKANTKKDASAAVRSVRGTSRETGAAGTSTVALHASTSTSRKGAATAVEEARSPRTSAVHKPCTGKGSPRAIPQDAKMSCRLLPVLPSPATSSSLSSSRSSPQNGSGAAPSLAVKRSRTSTGVPPVEERHRRKKNAKEEEEKEEEEEEEKKGKEMGGSAGGVGERLGRVRRLEETPWKPFAKLRATQEQTKSAPVLPTEEEREAFLHGPWVQSFYLYPPDAGEDLVDTLTYHIQHGRTGAIFLTPKVDAHSAVFSLLEHVLHVIQEVSIETQQDSAYTYPLLHAMGNSLLEPLLQLMQDIGSYESNLRKQHRTPGTLSVYPSPRAHTAHSTANGEPFVYVRWFRRNAEGTIWVFLLSHGGLQAYVNNDYELRWVESEEGRVFRIRNNGVCDIITRDFPIFSLIEALLYDP